jgi:hypothetical protein
MMSEREGMKYLQLCGGLLLQGEKDGTKSGEKGEVCLTWLESEIGTGFEGRRDEKSRFELESPLALSLSSLWWMWGVMAWEFVGKVIRNLVGDSGYFAIDHGNGQR